MTPLGTILIAMALVLSLFLVLPFLMRPKYEVIRRLGSVQLSTQVNGIRISSVIIQKSGVNGRPEKGLFILGLNRAGRHDVEHSQVFPISAQRIDEMIVLLQTQQVFTVTWEADDPVELQLNLPANVITLICKGFGWMQRTFLAELTEDDMHKLHELFEGLKTESLPETSNS